MITNVSQPSYSMLKNLKSSCQRTIFDGKHFGHIHLLTVLLIQPS